MLKPYMTKSIQIVLNNDEKKRSKFMKSIWPKQHALNQCSCPSEPFLLVSLSSLSLITHSSYSANTLLKFICKKIYLSPSTFELLDVSIHFSKSQVLS